MKDIFLDTRETGIFQFPICPDFPSKAQTADGVILHLFLSCKHYDGGNGLKMIVAIVWNCKSAGSWCFTMFQQVDTSLVFCSLGFPGNYLATPRSIPHNTAITSWDGHCNLQVLLRFRIKKVPKPRGFRRPSMDCLQRLLIIFHEKTPYPGCLSSKLFFWKIPGSGNGGKCI